MEITTYNKKKKREKTNKMKTDLFAAVANFCAQVNLSFP
jgi:hypothetical protein